MILRNLDELKNDPLSFLLFLFLAIGSLILAITVHEFSHALVATGLGDTTAKRLGRLSLNPLVHLDPAGSLMLLLVGFGWGKPVPVNAWNFGRNAFRGMAMVASAGPFSNLVTATLLAIPFKMGLLIWPFISGARLFSTPLEYLISYALGMAVLFNLVLAVFNLIPLAPMDGSKVIPGLLPQDLARSYHRLEPWGPGILMAIIFADIFFQTGILVRLIGPAVNLLSGLVVGESIF